MEFLDLFSGIGGFRRGLERSGHRCIGHVEIDKYANISYMAMYGLSYCKYGMDCQHFFRQIFLGYFSDIVQAFDTLRKNVCGDDYTSLHNPIVLSSVLPAYGMFHSIQILFL